jgi:hypothetical protein
MKIALIWRLAALKEEIRTLFPAIITMAGLMYNAAKLIDL